MISACWSCCRASERKGSAEKNYGRIQMNQIEFLIIVIIQLVQRDLVQSHSILQNKCKQVVNKALCKWCGLIPPPVWPVLTHIFLLWYGKQCEKYLGLCYKHRCHQRGETGLIDGLSRRGTAVWTPPAAHSVIGVSAFLDEKWNSVSLPRQKVQQCE